MVSVGFDSPHTYCCLIATQLTTNTNQERQVLNMKVVYQLKTYDVAKAKDTIDTYEKKVPSYHVAELVIQALSKNPACISSQIIQ